MADNIPVTPGTGSIVAADDIGGILHQRIKLVLGNDGVSNGDVSSTNPMPVQLTAAQISTLTPLAHLITAIAPYANRLSDGTAFYDARLIRALTSSDVVTVANPVTSLSVSNFPATQAISNAIESSSTGTITSAASAVTSFSVLAANVNRKGFIILNEGTSVVRIAFAATASTTSTTLILNANQSYFSTQLPIYRGVISAISNNTNSTLRITELT